MRHLLSRGKPAVRGRELNAEARPGQRALRGNIGGVPTLSWIARGVSIIPARRYATFPRICVNEEPGNAVPLMLREVAPRQVRLTIDLHEDDLREIALRGYEGAASTDRKAQAEVAMFVSDKVFQQASDKYTSFGPRLPRDLIRRHPPIQARMILRCPQTRGAGMTKALTGEPDRANDVGLRPRVVRR